MDVVNRKQTKVQAKLSKLNETPWLTRGLYGLRSREQLHNIREVEGLEEKVFWYVRISTKLGEQKYLLLFMKVNFL